MVKFLSLVFVGLLVYAHLMDVQGDVYHRPLSMFREFGPPWIGYALFGVLLAVGGETFRVAVRVRAESAMGLYFATTGLLFIIAITPSEGLRHTAFSAVAMLVVYCYFSSLLYSHGRWCVCAMHVSMPGLLLIATRCESYGSWQKGMIVYLLAAITVHHHILVHSLPNRTRSDLTVQQNGIRRTRRSSKATRRSGTRLRCMRAQWQTVDVTPNDF